MPCGPGSAQNKSGLSGLAQIHASEFDPSQNRFSLGMMIEASDPENLNINIDYKYIRQRQVHRYKLGSCISMSMMLFVALKTQFASFLSNLLFLYPPIIGHS